MVAVFMMNDASQNHALTNHALLCSHHWSAVLTATPHLSTWGQAEFLAALHAAVRDTGLTAVGELAVTFQPQGVSAVLLLAESHVALHFWPEKGKLSVDIHICDFQADNRPKALALAQRLAQDLSDQPADWRGVSVQG
jgi:S-adenosylmethionine decarboxylase